MLSYLQGGPKRRRSANLLSSFSSQDNHGEPATSQPSSPSKRKGSKDSTSPTAPSRLPPISQIATRKDKSGNESVTGQQRHWSFKGERPQFEPAHSAAFATRPIYTSNSYHSSNPLSSESNEEDAATIRRKRPIDQRFEQMRSYSEMPFQPSIYHQPVYPHIISQPVNPPTPPPKTAPGFSRNSSEPEPPMMSNEAPPTLSKTPTSRHSTWNSKIFNHSQRQPTEQSLEPTADRAQPSSSGQQRNNKPRLNLKNPMALWTKRRSQKPPERTLAENQSAPAPKLPDDYDPRIRGHKVHDFSAPRMSRPPTSKQEHGTSGKRLPAPLDLSKRKPSPARQEQEHTPVFKEHFDNGLEKSQDPATRSEAFMRTAAVQASQPEPDASHLPKFARNLPAKLPPDSGKTSKEPSRRSSGALKIVVEPPDRNQSPSIPSPTMSPPKAGSRATSMSDRTTSGLGSPKRYMSNSSRFSFDLAGVGSATQEKLLEEKHRQKAAQKQRESTLSNGSMYDEEPFIDFDDDDDGLEERIPGVNCDVEEDPVESKMPVLQRDMESFQFISPQKSSFDSTASPVSTGVTSLDTQALGAPWANTVASKSSPNLALFPSPETASTVDTLTGLRPKSTPGESSKQLEENPVSPISEPFEQSVPAKDLSVSEDDMYFDDGMIDEIGELSDVDDFDENVFDDNSHGLYGLPLRDRTLRPLEDNGNAVDADRQKQTIASQNGIVDSQVPASGSPHQSLSDGSVSAEIRDALTELGQPSIPTFSQTAGLTRDNLAAYNHNALSMAVNQAAQNGTFERSASISGQDVPQLPPLKTNIPANGAHPVPQLPESSSNTPPGFDDFGSDGLDDDAMVAAANAEALENDDDGIYGQEFGFFARASGSSTEDECVNGGYFGSRGLNDGIHRSHSGKANFQEPSLTPITERSEWSNRNSTIFAQHGHPLSAISATSQGWNEMPLEDVNMQLAMLKQLRRGAWGGSETSLHSSSGSQQSGSPLTYVTPQQSFLVGPPLQASNTAFAGFTHTPSSRPSSNDSATSPERDSPTITLPIQKPPSLSPTTAHPPPSSVSTTSSTTPTVATASAATRAMPPPPKPLNSSSGTKCIIPQPPLTAPLPSTTNTTLIPQASSSVKAANRSKHNRNSSAGESVSYKKEEGGRWVMEKRRLSETGEGVMVGRSLVEGGRI